MRSLLLTVLALLGSAGALRVGPAPVGRRAAVSSAGAFLAGLVAQRASAKSAPPTLAEMQRGGKDDAAAERLLKQVSFQDLVAKSVARKEQELGRPLTEKETYEIAAKIQAMLGMD